MITWPLVPLIASFKDRERDERLGRGGIMAEVFYGG